MTPEGLKLQDFCDVRGLDNLIKEHTCFEGVTPLALTLY